MKPNDSRILNRLTLFLVIVCIVSNIPVYAQSSMFADPKANQSGDALTIILAERTSAQRESGWENSSDAAMGGSSTLTGNSNISGKFGVDATFNRDAKNNNQSVQKDLLSGTITALITTVEPNGLMHIAGERKLNVNGESHLLKVSGIVRPFDVRYDNTVLSYQIANADIEYRRGGLHRKFFKPGMFVRTAVVALIGAAVVFGATQ